MSRRTMPRRAGTRGRARHRVALALGMVIAVLACGSLEEPVVRFQGVRVGSLGLDGGLLYVRVRVVNPNRFGLEARTVEYDVDLREHPEGEWVDLAEGVYEEEIRVPGRDSANVEIPVQFTYRQMGPAIRSVLSRGSLTLRAAGAVQVTEPLRRRVTFRREATVDVADGR